MPRIQPTSKQLLEEMKKQRRMPDRTRLIIRCVAHPDSHAKKIELGGMTRQMFEDFAGLLCGTSRFFIHKPGPDSPIGKCATCGAALTWEMEEMEG